MSAAVTVRRLKKLASMSLDSGRHGSIKEGHCAMELVAWVANEPHTDRPVCVCPVFATLVEQEVPFYGVDNCVLCVEVDGERVAFEAIEDRHDGYRSCMKDLEQVPLDGHIFFGTPVATVRLEDCTQRYPGGSHGFAGWQLVDVKTGHVWLVVGTDHYDDYYPSFTFDYRASPELVP